MRIRLKGINSITKRLADGTKRTYWYAWKGGPSLPGEPGSPEFIASYNAAAARKVAPPDGTILKLLQGYQASDDFRSRRDRTRQDYVGKIKLSSSSSATSRSRRSPTAERAESLWRGVIGWR
jgi:hypothetical protein